MRKLRRIGEISVFDDKLSRKTQGVSEVFEGSFYERHLFDLRLLNVGFVHLHHMLIDENALSHWMDHFYGYGSWQAPIWFIGYEESGGDLPEEVAEKLNYFHNAHAIDVQPTLCDIRELYRQVEARADRPKASTFRNLFEYRFGDRAIKHGVWKNLIAFVHGYGNKEIPDSIKYQQEDFVSPKVKSEALIQLYPLPSPHNHAWYYSWLDLSSKFKFLKSRESYEQQLFPFRMRSILKNISTHRPEVVLMYGMNNINALKKSIISFFPDVKFKMVKAVKQQIPQYHKADINGTILLITTQIPALRHNRIETGFDWGAMGRIVAET